MSVNVKQPSQTKAGGGVQSAGWFRPRMLFCYAMKHLERLSGGGLLSVPRARSKHGEAALAHLQPPTVGLLHRSALPLPLRSHRIPLNLSCALIYSIAFLKLSFNKISSGFLCKTL